MSQLRIALVPKRKGSFDLGTEVLEEFGYDREAGNDDPDGDLGPGPQADHDRVVTDIGRFHDQESEVCARERKGAGPVRVSTWLL